MKSPRLTFKIAFKATFKIAFQNKDLDTQNKAFKHFKSDF